MILSCYSSKGEIFDETLTLSENKCNTKIFKIANLDIRTFILAASNSRIFWNIQSTNYDILTSVETLIKSLITNELNILKIEDEIFKKLIGKCSQILECNILLMPIENEIKLVEFNLLKNGSFNELISKSKIIRMVFTIKNFENFLVTLKENGRIIISPNPTNEEVCNIVKQILI
ncbi:MAG: hypothetical protein AB7V56_06860 [Candidatus Nitrosocosmicus sp.]